MLDTGAAAPCVSASLPGLLHVTLPPATSWPVSANDSLLKCLGAFVADVVVGPRLIQNKVKVLVVENLSAPGIWGNDVSSKFGHFAENYRAQVFMVGGYRIALEQRRGAATPG